MIKMLRMASIGLCLLLANQAWAGSCKLTPYGTLPVTMIGEKPMTTAKVNGTSEQFMLETGSVFDMMPRDEAQSLGLTLLSAPSGFRLGAIGGPVHVKLTQMTALGILGTTINHIQFIVGGNDLGHGSLGAGFLDSADLDIDLAHGKMSLFKAHDCKKSALAYWTKGGNYNVADIEQGDSDYDSRTYLNVMIDGKKVRAMLASGAVSTELSRAAAKRIGIDLDGPSVKVGTLRGIGARTLKTWTVPIATFSVGTETIQHSQMLVIDTSFGNDLDMLLGVDFLLAHHVYIANSQGKMYFTYNGGRLFTFAKASDSSTPTDAGTAMANANAGPKTASDYARQGQADLSRGEPQAAVADLSQAIQLAPGDAAYYLARARAYTAQKQIDPARADLDKALSLDPKNVDALLSRAVIRLRHQDRAGAEADVAAASTLTIAGSAQARLLASLDIQLGHPAEALPLLDSWIPLHHDDARLGQALNARCLARSLTNQLLKKALDDCREAIRRDGKRPGYLANLGLVELRLGNYAESIKADRHAVALMPHAAWWTYCLGLAELDNGQTIAGNADLAIARGMDPKIDARAAKFGLVAARR